MACASDDLGETKQSFDKAITSAEFLQMKNKRVVMLLPKVGCTGCISSAETFMKDHAAVYPEDFGVILTDVVSLKTLRIKLGGELIDLDNVALDTGNYFTSKQLKSLYPTLIYQRSGEITSIEYVSPEMPFALDSLILRLTRWSGN
ncbi:MAG: hypothetical protein Roseis2KO_40490 [Roseivirga sp.]